MSPNSASYKKRLRALATQEQRRFVDRQNKDLHVSLYKLLNLYHHNPDHLKTHGLEMRVATFKTQLDLAHTILKMFETQGIKIKVELDDMMNTRRTLMLHCPMPNRFRLSPHQQQQQQCRHLSPHSAQDIVAIASEALQNVSNMPHILQHIVQLHHRGYFTSKTGGYDTSNLCKLLEMIIEDNKLFSYQDTKTIDETIKRFVKSRKNT